MRDVGSWWHRGDLLNLSTPVLLSLSSPTHPSPLSLSSLPLAGSPRPPEEAASHKLASGRWAGGGALLGSSLCLGAEREEEGGRVHPPSPMLWIQLRRVPSNVVVYPVPLSSYAARSGYTGPVCSGRGGGRKHRMGVGDSPQKIVGPGWLRSSELVRDPCCKVPSWVPCTRSRSWASQRGRGARGWGSPQEATVEKVQCPQLWRCSASLQGKARGEKGRDGRV